MREQFEWVVYDCETRDVQIFEEFSPRHFFMKMYLPYFDMFAQGFTPWAPDAKSFAYVAANSAFIQEVRLYYVIDCTITIYILVYEVLYYTGIIPYHTLCACVHFLTIDPPPFPPLPSLPNTPCPVRSMCAWCHQRTAQLMGDIQVPDEGQIPPPGELGPNIDFVSWSFC